VTKYKTVFASLDKFEKGGVEVINDDPKNYVFSNMFEVASQSKPWEKVAIARNVEYVLEAIRAEGVSEWRVTPHDEFAIVVDGEVVIELLDPESTLVDPTSSGSIAVQGEPKGVVMGKITARRGHLALLPAGKCYRMIADHPSVVILQTVMGPDTIERWAQICQKY
jgi:sarcosine oxidase gamma subunit